MCISNILLWQQLPSSPASLTPCFLSFCCFFLLYERTKPFPSSRSLHLFSLCPRRSSYSSLLRRIILIFVSPKNVISCHIYNFDRYCQIASQKELYCLVPTIAYENSYLPMSSSNTVFYQSFEFNSLIRKNMSHLTRWASAPVIVRGTGGSAYSLLSFPVSSR